ncbi:hypothetical protein MNAN1_001696 [Malassezia nana]|uniref:General alpha-glucoside permease n=1 Tax=Malassezia nana TaxID=180528 RepID=A0AAF0EKY3_9BASI|nr:hypothetical protein MNAN1_001696 [Malassezia nana]
MMGHLGTHVVWSLLNARATLFLQRIGIYKSLVAVIVSAGPLSGLIVQPVVGVMSDRSTHAWGRRRPFLFAGLGGCITSLVFLICSSSLSGKEQKLLSALAIVLGVLGIMGIDVSVNTMSAAHRAMTMDIMGPEEQDMANAWATRYGSLGSVLGYMLGEMDLPRVFAFLHTWDQLGILSLCAITLLLCTHLPLLFLVRESVLRESSHHSRLGVFAALRVIVSDLVRCGATLPAPIWDLFTIQFFSWLSWFPVLYYCTSWVAEIYSRAHDRLPQAASGTDAMGESARRVGSQAMFYYALAGLASSIVLPWLIHDPLRSPRISRAQYEPASQHNTDTPLEGTTGSLPHEAGAPAPAPSNTRVSRRPWWFRGPTLAEVWFLSQVLFVVVMLFFTCPVVSYKSVPGAIALVSVLGVSWSITLWVPYALLGILLYSSEPLPAARSSEAVAMQPMGQAPAVPPTQAEDGVKTTDLRAEAGTIMGLHNWSIVLPQLAVSLISALGAYDRLT